jgi:hypothetical protein
LDPADMLYEDEARDMLNGRVHAGSRLVMAKHADLATVKRFRDDCLKADIPAMLGPCAPGG